jgi:16S rRNA processing protein RimM
VAEISDPVVIGRVGAPHGVRGTVRVRAAGSGRHLREGVEPFIEDRRRRILRSRATPKGFLVDLEGVGSRVEAAKLRGVDLVLDRPELDPPEEDEVYVNDLIGLEAVDEKGERLGAVTETFATPAHEVLIVRGDGAGPDSETYVPFTLEHVPELDLASGRIVVRLPQE